MSFIFCLGALSKWQQSGEEPKQKGAVSLGRTNRDQGPRLLEQLTLCAGDGTTEEGETQKSSPQNMRRSFL